MKNYWGTSLIVSVIAHTFFISDYFTFRNFQDYSHDVHVLRQVKIIPEKIKTLPSLQNSLEKIPSPPQCYDTLQNIFTKTRFNQIIDKPQMIEENLEKIVFTDISENQQLKEIPAYMQYYRTIRERIRANAYQYYRSTKKGEVFLSFVISHDGRLGKIYSNGLSVGDRDLIQISFQSVMDASPFPAFPCELKEYAQLQFHISIYFKNN